VLSVMSKSVNCFIKLIICIKECTGFEQAFKLIKLRMFCP